MLSGDCPTEGELELEEVVFDAWLAGGEDGGVLLFSEELNNSLGTRPSSGSRLRGDTLYFSVSSLVHFHCSFSSNNTSLLVMILPFCGLYNR